MTVTSLKRVFLHKERRLRDLSPGISPTRSLLLYQDLFPEMQRCVAVPRGVNLEDRTWEFDVIMIA